MVTKFEVGKTYEYKNGDTVEILDTTDGGSFVDMLGDIVIGKWNTKDCKDKILQMLNVPSMPNDWKEKAA
jgi:hypothetical protein